MIVLDKLEIDNKRLENVLDNQDISSLKYEIRKLNENNNKNNINDIKEKINALFLIKSRLEKIFFNENDIFEKSSYDIKYINKLKNLFELKVKIIQKKIYLENVLNEFFAMKNLFDKYFLLIDEKHYINEIDVLILRMRTSYEIYEKKLSMLKSDLQFITKKVFKKAFERKYKIINSEFFDN